MERRTVLGAVGATAALGGCVTNVTDLWEDDPH